MQLLPDAVPRHARHTGARNEADRIVEILKLAAAGDDSLLLTVRPEQLHQALISRNADPVFVQYAIKQCHVDGGMSDCTLQ